MLNLNELELNEFKKTYDFLNHYIGSTCAKNINELRFNKSLVNQEIRDFLNALLQIQEVKELGLKFTSKDSAIKRCNLLFCDASKYHKDLILMRLIRYCKKHHVQPHRLRMSSYNSEVINSNYNPPIVTEYVSETAS